MPNTQRWDRENWLNRIERVASDLVKIFKKREQERKKKSEDVSNAK